jgi:phage terminase Nu1 subunit (DNA packaging protein)
LAVQSLKSGGSLSLGAEVDVSETLERTGVAVGGERDTGDVAVFSEDLLDALVAAFERDVAEEEGVAGSAALVTVLVRTGTTFGLLLTRSAEVDV